jgi:hypothetical protein
MPRPAVLSCAHILKRQSADLCGACTSSSRFDSVSHYKRALSDPFAEHLSVILERIQKQYDKKSLNPPGIDELPLFWDAINQLGTYGAWIDGFVMD